MNEVIERLNNYLSGYKYQYDYFDDNGLEHCLDDDIKQLLKNIKKLQQENQELKKQHKEFIQWLKNESKILIRDAGYHQRICLEILDKYKEIIGGDNK